MQDGPEAVLVVGGVNSIPGFLFYYNSSETSRCAELLTHTAISSRGGGGGGGETWQWRKLNPMLGGHSRRPGMLLLPGGARQRVLVAGGGAISTAEILQLSCSDPFDNGQWTRIAPLSHWFYETFLVEWSNRIFAISSFVACITLSFSKNLLHLFWLFRLDWQCERTHKQCARPGYCKSNFERQDAIYCPLVFNLFCGSNSWRLLSRFVGDIWNDCEISQHSCSHYVQNEPFKFCQDSILC